MLQNAAMFLIAEDLATEPCQYLIRVTMNQAMWYKNYAPAVIGTILIKNVCDGKKTVKLYFYQIVAPAPAHFSLSSNNQ